MSSAKSHAYASASPSGSLAEIENVTAAFKAGLVVLATIGIAAGGRLPANAPRFTTTSSASGVVPAFCRGVM